MADIRIKDLATTATTTASDDFMAVDGVTNGTRKLSAATPAFLTSVTTPSLTSPASTNLTLAGGAGNSSIILTPAGTGNVGIGTTTPAGKLEIKATDNSDLFRLSYTAAPTAFYLNIRNPVLASGVVGYAFDVLNDSTSYASNLVLDRGNASIGAGTSGLTGTGGLKINSTTAGASNAGALVVAGGLATGAASYIGGALTVNGPSNAYNFIRNNATNSTTQLRLDNLATENSGVLSGMTFRINATDYADIAAQPSGGVFSDTTAGFYIISRSATAAMKFVTGAYNNTPAFTLAAGSTGAATFAGAVTIGNTVNTVSPTSPNRTVTMVVNGVTLYLAAKTTND